MEMAQGKIIDLFCGAGGFSLSAHRAGFSTVLAVDIDKDITSSYGINFPKTPILLDDISKIEPLQAIKQVNLKPEEVDGIIGGPPCQGFSYMGKREKEDKRNTLIGHFYRFVDIVKPKFFVMENVPGLLDEPFKDFLYSGLELVQSTYEIVGPLILNAADFGAATNRKRLFVIGYRKEHVDSFGESEIEEMKSRAATVSDAIGDLSLKDATTITINDERWGDFRDYKNKHVSHYASILRSPPTDDFSTETIRRLHGQGIISGFTETKHSLDVSKRFAKLNPGKSDEISKCPRLNWDTPGPTLRAGTGRDKGGFQSIRPVHPTENRVIYVREGARLQGFPDWFQFHRTKWHSFRMIGNSVSPSVGSAVFTVIGKRLQIAKFVTPASYKSISAYTG